MKIKLDSENTNFYKIISYSNNYFQLKDKTVDSNLLISKNYFRENWLKEGHQHLATQHLDEILSLEPEIILIGTGKQLVFPDQELISYVTAKNIGFEVMDTGAACRSYNLLIDEGRDVVACLFLSQV